MNLSLKSNKMSTQYNYHEITKSNYKKYFLFLIYFIIMSVSLMIFIKSLWLTDQRFDAHIFSLNQNENLASTVSENFLSFGVDSSLLRNMKKLPINDQRFINLARYLSPAYVRFGGTAADCLYFNETDTDRSIKDQHSEKSPAVLDSNDITKFTITSNDFESLYEFTQKAKINMMFDLNVLIRNTDNSWDSSNAEKIINFAKGHAMKIDWQMGNEPNSFLHVFNVSVSPEQLAKDYRKLRSLLDKSGFQDSITVGPEANHIGDDNHGGVNYVKKFVDNVNKSVDYISWHQYYLNGHIAQVEDFLNAENFNRLPAQIQSITESIGSHIPMWLSETGSAYGGGAPKLSDRFVAGFLWLDKLGYAAKAGIQVVIRQSFFGNHYAMVGPDLIPNPDWWIAVIYKRFVSEKVLNLVGPNNFGNVRLYAHCASKRVSKTGDSIVIYGMNLNEELRNIYIQDLPKESKIQMYILTSDDLQSSKISLNGDVLKLKKDGSLPLLKPKIIKPNQLITLPDYSMVFLLIHGLKVPACF